MATLQDSSPYLFSTCQRKSPDHRQIGPPSCEQQSIYADPSKMVLFLLCVFAANQHINKMPFHIRFHMLYFSMCDTLISHIVC